MRAPAPDTARAWKDHRRTCEHCELGRPGCATGRELFEQHRIALQRGREPEPSRRRDLAEGVEVSGLAGNALSGSRMGTAFVWGFWFTIGAGVASIVVVLVWMILWGSLVAAVLADLD